MEYFRRYLIGLRKFQNEGLFGNLMIFLLSLSFVGVAVGFLLDLLLPFNYFLNMIRGIVSILTGAFLFSFSYLYSSKISDKKRNADRYYQSVRYRFSYKQRVNFSILVGSLSILFTLLGNKNSVVFTLKSSFIMFVILSLLAFTRRLRTEFIKDIHEIPDLRDLEAQARKRKKS